MGYQKVLCELKAVQARVFQKGAESDSAWGFMKEDRKEDNEAQTGLVLKPLTH